MAVCCKAVRPPVNSKAMAKKDWVAPQAIFLSAGGFKSPLEVIIPKTKVAESAEVMKKIKRRINAVKERKLPIGKWLNIK